MAIITTPNGDCQVPGPPDGTPIPAADPCRGAEVRALPGTMWLVGLDDNSHNPGNDDDFWDVFFRLTFGPEAEGWVSMRYAYLGGETAHRVRVKVEEQWVELEGEMDLNPVRVGDALRIKIKDFDDGSVGMSPDAGVIWAAQVGGPPTGVPEPQTWGMIVAGAVVLAAGRMRRWIRG